MTTTTPAPPSLRAPVLLSFRDIDGPGIAAFVSGDVALELVGRKAWWAWRGARFRRVVVGVG